MAKKKDKEANKGKMDPHHQGESPHLEPFPEGPSTPQDFQNNERNENMPSTLTVDGVEHKRYPNGPLEVEENEGAYQLDTSVQADRRSYTECAVLILREQANHKPMHYRKITKAAIEKGILHTNGQTPEATMYAQVLMENKRRESRAEQPRFICLGKGMIGLAEWKNSGPSAQIEEANRKVKEQLLEKLHDMDPQKFEELVTRVFAALGFSDTMTTQYTRDGGVDVRGVMEVEGLIKQPVSVQVKRQRDNVRAPIVDALRGALHVGEHGVVVTTSNFTRGARISAADSTKAAGIVDLINGHEFVDLMVTYGICVTRDKYNQLSIAQNPEEE